MRYRGLFGAALLAVITGCGAGTAPSGTGAAGTANTAALGQASLTLKFPSTFVRARAAASAGRSAQYVNPTLGDMLVVAVNGTTVINPSSGQPFFAVSAPHSDGTSVFTFPIAGGLYPAGSIQITESDRSGRGTVLAYGSNQSYTQATGAVISGDVTISPGAISAFTVTLVMNAQAIALTSDVTQGRDARALSTDQFSPTLFCPMFGNTLYPFAADASNGFVLPGTAAGVPSGSDTNSPYTGTSSAALFAQYSPDGSHLIATAIGYIASFVSPSSAITATFHTVNPLSLVNEPGSPPVATDTYGYAIITSPSACS